jgi:hypothetical protein
MSRKPPKLATALLNGFTAHDGALAGDLLERYRSGQSLWWYWRQVIAIIGASTSSEVRRHPTITMRAIALGFAFTWLMRRYVIWDLMHYDEWLFSTGLVRWLYVHDYSLPVSAIWPATAVLYGLSGWIVGRASRESAGIVLLYVAAGEFLFFGATGAWRFVYDPLPDPLLPILTVVRPISALLGGLWAVSGRHSARSRLHV